MRSNVSKTLSVRRSSLDIAPTELADNPYGIGYKDFAPLEHERAFDMSSHAPLAHSPTRPLAHTPTRRYADTPGFPPTNRKPCMI
jgi:hypothetical protein